MVLGAGRHPIRRVPADSKELPGKRLVLARERLGFGRCGLGLLCQPLAVVDGRGHLAARVAAIARGHGGVRGCVVRVLGHEAVEILDERAVLARRARLSFSMWSEKSRSV